MGKNKSILLTIEDEEWNRFKSKVCLRGLSVAGVIKGFVASYCREEESEADSGREKVVVKPVRIVGRKKRPALERGKKTDARLAEYAALFSIEDENDDSLREKVLDAVEKEHAERSGEDGWLERNLDMVRWYNGQK